MALEHLVLAFLRPHYLHPTGLTKLPPELFDQPLRLSCLNYGKRRRTAAGHQRSNRAMLLKEFLVQTKHREFV